MRLHGTLGIVAAAALATVLGASPGQAAGESRTLAGPVTGDADVYLTYVRCDDLFGAASAPQSRINLGPYAAPLGRRSLGLVPKAAGSAAGPYTSFDSLARLDASVSVAATAGTQGVSWVMAVTGSNPAGTAWSGRAAVGAPAGSWSTVSTADVVYDWSLVDLASGATVDRVGRGTPAQFAASHGNGAGFAVTGFGCDGRAFNLDAVRGGGATFDFEGGRLVTSIAAGREQTRPGEEVQLTGRVTDAAGRVTGDPLVLESRTPGGTWAPVGKPVLAGRDGVARVAVPVTETTEFRWRRPEGQYADEGWSDTVTVTVAAQDQGPAPTQGQGDQGQGDQGQADQGQGDQGEGEQETAAAASKN